MRAAAGRRKCVKTDRISNKQAGRFSSLWCHAAAILFALFMVFGRSFEKRDSWELVLEDGTTMLLSLVQGICWYLAFLLAVSWLFRFLDRALAAGRAAHAPDGRKAGIFRLLAGKYLAQLETHPARTTFCTLILVNLPYMVLSYPAIFMGDTPSQIGQALGSRELTNHHPITHTLLISFFLHIGDLLGSDNAGIFLYTLTQTLAICAVMACAVKALAEIGVNRLLLAGILLYYCVHPRISAFFFLVTKDVPYAAFFTLFYVTLFKLLRGAPFRKRDYAALGAGIVGMICLRNDGQYVIFLTLLLALLYKAARKKALAFLGVAAAAVLSLNWIVFPLLNVEPGSIREMLSLPFQQTARYLRDAGWDVTEEEKAAIDRVLDYDVLAESYDPDLSDNVKSTYHGETEDLKDYFSAWFQMLLRHPGIYIQATMNNYYQYFYPGESLFNGYTYSWGGQVMETVNDAEGTDFNLPEQLQSLREGYQSLREDTFRTPLLSWLNSPALYTWAAILYLLYCLRRKSFVGFVYGVPMLVQMLIFITGPTNGAYCRYEYPMLIYLPAVLLLGLRLMGIPQRRQADDAI